MMSKRAVLFDFDLTLADSTLGAVECINYALEAMALPHAEPKAIRATIGFSLPATLASLTGLTDPALAQNFSLNFVKRADLRMVELTSVFPDVAQTLDQLKAAGIKTGIVSTKFRYRIETILTRAGLSEVFDVIVGGEDVMRHKPDPEGLVKALDKLGVQSGDSLYVGDHPVDAEAAAVAGIPFAAVLTGAATRNDFEPWPATMFLSSLRELAPLLRL
ncbi:HAD family hydrolase [Bradyrhizobium canariense]|uniref:phosphoglycolate phosphatase n=1 Tax=Bradyrhizobium canariense TaxID=255045 RepID=A0A1H1NLJ2_9BRAD|nr:HAD-IA family hydrolase [Bradyrhizobium canariense]SDR99189.1 phosphoglycolate phosphatase [Bradyrhizobium canariense]